MIINPELLKLKCLKCEKILEINEFVYCVNCEEKEMKNGGKNDDTTEQ